MFSNINFKTKCLEKNYTRTIKQENFELYQIFMQTFLCENVSMLAFCVH